MANRMQIVKAADHIQRVNQLLAVAIGRDALAPIERDLALDHLRRAYEALIGDQPLADTVPSPSELQPARAEGLAQEQIAPGPADGLAAQARAGMAGELAQADSPAPAPAPAPSAPPIAPVGVAADQPPAPAQPRQPLRPEAAPAPTPPEPSHSVGNGAGSRANAETIGEKYQGTKKFRNETLAVSKSDVSAKQQNKPIDDLTKAIGINDKFLFTKELFNGNAGLYAATIRRLNEFSDINEALIYIQDNFRWDQGNEAASQLIDLVRRKLLKV